MLKYKSVESALKNDSGVISQLKGELIMRIGIPTEIKKQ